ncbi:MAG: phosphatidylserine/phosphatidylglycerophosphate/cardiolipin synthase family protein [Candidatus Krumholzibacteria bacterium]|nr:phosphatidylserine/phosphatidylglycerophosphate/cardiolipin synthase family protein [Candidatus Krumholzibacteria bacterium]
MKTQIQVDADEFWPSLQSDIRSARAHVYLQTLSFEGDTVGKGLAQELTACGAADRRIIADEFYTKHRINDNFLHNPKHWFDRELRKERDDTLAMIADLRGEGVGVKLTNPSGPMAMRFLHRNHKKIIVIDDRIAYVGGINFSEHNFTWHDLMFRIEDAGLARFLKDDFLDTWSGKHANTSKRFDNVEIHRFDGKNNHESYKPILAMIASARKTIYIESPYVAYPFYDALRRARANGVRVILITPDLNNWGVMREYVIWESARADIDLRLYKGRMLHVKAMLIDDTILITGSSNFDFISAQFMQEVIAVITDQAVIAEFKEKVLNKDLENTSLCDEKISHLRGVYHIARLKLMSAIFRTAVKILPGGGS